MKSKRNTYKAVLVHGRRYSVLSANSEEEVVFKRGKGVPISAELKCLLETNAVDQITFERRPGQECIEERCKFRFDPIAETDTELSSDKEAQ